MTGAALVEGGHRVERLVRLPEVLRMTGRSRTTTLDDVKAGTFPQPIKIGRATMWVEAEIQGWIAERIRTSRAARTTPAAGTTTGAR